MEREREREREESCSPFSQKYKHVKFLFPQGLEVRGATLDENFLPPPKKIPRLSSLPIFSSGFYA
jgi:hypothetical protein